MDDVPGVLTALAGVAVGTLLSFVSNWLSERARWRRDHRARWDERRLSAYLAYAEVLKAQIRITRRLAATIFAGRVATEPLGKDDAEREWALAEDRRSVSMEAVLMLGTSATIEAARRWQDVVWNMKARLGQPGCSVEQFNEDFVKAGDARDRWLIAARHDLCVGDTLHRRPQWDWAYDLGRAAP